MGKKHLNYNIDRSTIVYTEKGANFAITPKHIPTDEFIVATEEAEKYMSKSEGLAMKAEIVEVISTAKKPVSNITKSQRDAIKELKENKDIIIVPADKGRCLVVMDKKEYIEKMEKKLR